MKSDASQGRRDIGAALLLAIAVVTGISVALAAALGFAATSVKSSAESYQPAREALYTADAAVKIAAAHYRRLADGGLIADCADGTTTLQIDATTTVEVCDSQADGHSFDNQDPGPEFGLMTTSKTLGIDLRTGTIRIAGGVYSAATATGPSGSTTTNMLSIERGNLHAVGACDGNIEVATGYAQDCNASVVTVPVYTSGLDEAPAPGTAADCSLTAGYWSATSFGTATGGCDVVHLQPGLHYLHDVDWTVSNTVIGGTLSAGIDIDALDPTTDLPGACDVAAAGTMIVLGGTSSMTMNGQGAIEVCGMATTQGSEQVRIPLMGSDVALDGGGGVGTDVTLTGGTSASVTAIPRNGAKTAAVNLSTATDITSATALTLRYTSGSKTGNVTGTVTARSSGAGSDCAAGTLDLTGSTPAAIDLTACLSSLDLPLTLTFRFASASANGSGSVSGISVVASGVGSNAGSPVALLDGADTDPVLSTTATNKFVVLHGVTYLPTRPIDLNVPNDAEVGASRALIVESITINAGGGSAGDERPPIIGADLLEPGNGELTFDAYVDGDHWLTTRGQYTATAGSLSLAIDRWIVRR